MYSATFLIAVHPSSVTSSISHRSTVTSTWREVRTRASRRPSSSSVNRPQATTYGRDSGFPILSMTAMTADPGILEAGCNSRTIWGATPPKVYSPESLQNAVYRQLAVPRTNGKRHERDRNRSAHKLPRCHSVINNVDARDHTSAAPRRDHGRDSPPGFVASPASPPQGRSE